jgi:hypothetical protein
MISTRESTVAIVAIKFLITVQSYGFAIDLALTAYFRMRLRIPRSFA